MSETVAPRHVRMRRAVTGLVVALVLWWLATSVVAAPGDMLARFAPQAALPALVSLFTEGSGLLHVSVTLERLLLGLGLATVVGVPAGVAVGMSRRIADHTGALIQFLRMISPLAWTPIAIVLLGVGGAPVVFLVAVAAVWPVLLGAAAGVHALDPGWLQIATTLRATRRERLTSIVLPGIRSHLATGLRVALGTAWIVIVPAEMLGVDSGLGYAILDARDRLRYDEMMGIVLVIGALGFALDALAQQATRRHRRRPRRSAAVGEDDEGSGPTGVAGATSTSSSAPVVDGSTLAAAGGGRVGVPGPMMPGPTMPGPMMPGPMMLGPTMLGPTGGLPPRQPGNGR